MMRRFLMVLVALFSLGGLAVSEAKAGPGVCTGSFVNPITDVCWSCLFPISLGSMKIWPSSRPDTENPALPICLCATPIPRIGIAIGFWEPVRLADPRLFRAFQVEVVPTYVVTTNEIDLCDGLSCVSDVPPHDRMVGNVTAQYALETFANGGGPGAPASRIYARKLNRGAAG